MLCLMRTQCLLLHNSSNFIMVIVITFTQVIWNYIPETVRVSRVCSAAAVLHVQFVLHAEVCFVILH